ncbi:hypothetical protein G7081_06775 [Vagococcus coleopterorum]|uniref:Mga helix-turn-helix domain-containing protein n=1 Tax=Vagococcus coleopterorum TaxID=2714946 RepID=A0A6G8AP87_9ENTE|nr:helix-turn-helix domain-containing protein [Vagococcus coleopterorum]QIL46790.1 hypothetical protein G7081_06775 [Vagococcus coleopterorum]
MINLLNEHMNLKLDLLYYFEKHNDNLIPQWQIEEITHLSSFKTMNLIDELITDLSRYPESAIILDKKKIYYIKGITNEVINHLRLTYIQNSLHFQIYMFYFRGGHNLKILNHELGISNAYSYSLIKEINNELATYDIKINNQQLEGDEKKIRLLTFEMLAFYYKGITFVHDDPMVTKFEKRLLPFIKYLNITITPSTSFQWRLFIELIYYRLSQGMCVSTPTIRIDESDDKTIEIQRLNAIMSPIFKSTFHPLTEEEFNNEFYYLIEFLFSENLLIDQDIFTPDLFSDSVINPISSLISSIQKFKQDTGLTDEVITTLKYELIPVFFKFYHFSYKSDSFNATDHLGIFKNLYPDASLIVEDFFEKQNWNMDLPNNIQLYYDCMFRIINFVPQSVLESPLYICVDFSRGPVYSQHIKNNINAFQSLHIVFEKKITEKTMLYISDFSTYDYDIPQVIWKAPPTINDWDILGQTLVDMKRGSL